MKRLLLGLCSLGLLLSLVTTASSCKKEEGDYRLTVIVTVNDTTRVANAYLRIYAPVNNSSIDSYLNTDENGEVEMEFKNEAVVEIIGTKSGFRGCTFADIDRGDNIATLDLKPFGDTNNGCLNSN